MPKASMFKTPEGQARYFSAYGKTLALWPVPVEAIEVKTRSGLTHVNACGPADAPPLVLLPGQAISSTMWYANVETLCNHFRIFAYDILGDMGKSVPSVPDVRNLDFGAWLVEAFDALELDQPVVAGLSYGGYLAIRLALSAPARAGKLILMSPAGLLPLPLRYYFRMAAVFLPLSMRVRAELLGLNSPKAQPAFRQMMTKTDFRYTMVIPPIFSNNELMQVKAPTLLLFGDQDVVYKPEKAIQRAQTLIRSIKIDVIPGAGHALPLDQPDIVNRRIIEFAGGEYPDQSHPPE